MQEPVKIPRVFIIVLNWNGWKDTNECIASLQNLSYPNLHVLVVDNASTDSSVDNIQRKFPEIQILQSSENKGYAAGNNKGIRHALAHGADYIWILNNDTAVDPDALWPLVKKMENDTAIGMCGSLLKDYHQREQVQALGGGRYYKWLGITRLLVPKTKTAEYTIENIEQTLDFVIGASIFVSREFIEVIGLMNEQYFLFYEEIDWSIRSRETFKMGFEPESIVYHKLNASVNAGKKENQKRSKPADYYQIKNRLKFTQTYFAYCLPAVYMTIIYAILKRFLKGRWARAWMAVKLMFTYHN